MSLRIKRRISTGRVRSHEQEGMARGLGLAAEHLLGTSRAEVPVEEGTLERSGETSIDESSLEAAVSYGTKYATRQHEELTWRHDPGRKAKYLEDPYDAEAETMTELLAAELRRSLGG